MDLDLGLLGQDDQRQVGADIARTGAARVEIPARTSAQAEHNQEQPNQL
jgi:hypothetical protein